MSKRVAIVPGSFDPVTKGHINIIRRAAGIFDDVVIAVMVNAEKGDGMFLPKERLQILECATEDIENVRCALCEGLASDFAARCKAKYFVKGVRCATDFDYEYSLAEIMRKFDADIETVLLPAEPSLSHISSTYAKELIRYGCPLDDIADKKTAKLIEQIYNKKNKVF